MEHLHDILINAPLSSGVLDFLLFLIFTIHFIFVLFLIGTAIISVYYYLVIWLKKETDDIPWYQDILKTFLAHKSIAVVFGVGALLLIQVGYTIPFFMGTSIFPGYWMLIIVFLIISFLSFDTLGHKVNAFNKIHLPGGVIAVFFLLIVPGIFTAVLSTAEHNTEWINIIKNGNQLFGSLSVHWLFRYLHVVGAALVFSAAFHYFFSSKEQRVKKVKMIRWAILGILLQIILGILLFGTVQEKFSVYTYFIMLTGVLFALIFLWMVITDYSTGRELNSRKVVIILLLILLPMLLTRQDLQFKGFKPVIEKINKNQEVYSGMVSQYSDSALNKYQSKLKTVYDTGDKIYDNSCSFCHNKTGDGKGTEAKDLIIPPENLQSIKMKSEHLKEHIRNGVDGTAMPYFGYYLDNEIDDLVMHLNEKFSITGEPVRVGNISIEDRKEAIKVFKETCSVCHGEDYKGKTQISEGFKPEPPNFSEFSLNSDYAFNIITNGYNGTMMVSFGKIAEPVRWALVSLIQEQYNN